ncbi:hypothetical protein GGR92_004724 [Spirosoma lacussanchae]|uniref:hypothetical protein n=1 Tax=Spirosoma lacussanchae TaxID=1884249 RepID=UPI001FE2B574|nr:hypothetical protein [Spirosoma lacussanchae]
MILHLRSGWSVLLLGWLVLSGSVALAQRAVRPYEPPADYQPGIYFPQAPRPGEWRKSIGLIFTSTPPEITEEIRLLVPAIDVNLQHGLSKNWYLSARLQTQLVQSNLALGVRYATPVTEKLYAGLGIDGIGWFGALNIKDVFNSQAGGLEAIPHATLGYRLTRDLQLTFRTEAIMDLYYRSTVGPLAVEYDQRRLNGVAFTFALEQPFYKQQHVTLGLRAAYSNFNWQFWSLYDTFERDFFYPQLFFGFIL